MQVAPKFTHRPERHQAPEKAPISLKKAMIAHRRLPMKHSPSLARIA